MIVAAQGAVWGSYLHGVFDDDEFRRDFIDSVRVRNGLRPVRRVVARYDTEAEYDRLAALLRQNLDIEKIYQLIRSGDAESFLGNG